MSLKITYQGEELPCKTFQFNLQVGCKPSYAFTQCTSSQVDTFKSAGVGELTLNDGRDPLVDIIFSDIYFVRAEEVFGSDDTEDMCKLILADERILWYQNADADNYNTVTPDRRATTEYTINGVPNIPLVSLDNINAAVPWIFSTLLTNLNTQLGISFALGGGATAWPSHAIPLQIHALERSIADVWAQVLSQTQMYLVPSIVGITDSTVSLDDSIINQLGVADGSTAPSDATEYGAFLDKSFGIIVNEKLFVGTHAGVRMATDYQNYNAASPQLAISSEEVGSPYIYDIDLPINSLIADTDNGTELENWFDEISNRIDTGLQNRTFYRDLFAGWHPITLGHFAQGVEWKMDKRSCTTTVYAFYAPTPKPVFPDTYHSYDRWPNPLGTQYGIVRRAKTSEASGANNTIACNLYDQDGVEQVAGDESNITVYTTVNDGGGNNEDAAPVFRDDEDIFITLLPFNATTDRWYHLQGLSPFELCDEEE